MTVIQQLQNGLTVIAHPMPHVASAAYDLAIPGGIIGDTDTRIGASLLLAELTSRGAGGLDSRELSDVFDSLGVRHSEYAAKDKYCYRGSLLRNSLREGLKNVSRMACEPSLPEAELENVKNIFLQDFAALKDDPARRVLIELSKRYYPSPYNRPSLGEETGIEASTLSELRDAWSPLFAPSKSVLSVAGNVDPEDVFSIANDIFGPWTGSSPERPSFGDLGKPMTHYLPFDAAQLQIALAYPSARFDDADYYTAKVATQILSGGSFGRLFVEVRENRGLCYSVFARHSATRDYGTVTVYAGTTPERAQETLDVTQAVLTGMHSTVTTEELNRAKANLKTGLILGEESSAGRASSNAADYWIGERVRTVEEVLTAINKIEAADIDRYLDRYPPQACTLLTLGSKELEAER